MARHRRVDKKEVTLHLKTSVVKLYFGTVVGEGRWDKEARHYDLKWSKGVGVIQKLVINILISSITPKRI